MMSEEEAETLLPNDPLLPELYKNAPELCCIARQNGKIAAWFAGRYGLKSIHIGPLHAVDTSCALDAVNQARKITKGTIVTMDIMGYQNEFVEKLRLSGAEWRRDFLRMYHGTETAFDNPEMFAAAGPEYG